MRELIFKLGAPFGRMVLAADARRTATQYSDDQIWELALNRGEPPSLAVETSYGLRARAFRIFPRFTSEGKTISGPQEFAGPLKVRQFSPGYIQLNCQIFPNIELTYDLWVCSSQSLCGALHFLNTAKNTLAIQVEISGMLSPLLSSQTGGDRLSVQLAGNRPVLTGNTANLTPVIQMRSGMSGPAGPNPFIYQVLELPPNQVQTSQWVQAGGISLEKSLEIARAALDRPWEAEFSRLEMESKGQLEILTGNPLWDEVFERSKQIALRLLLSPHHSLAHPTFVASRQPDLGYSMRGDGSDYGPLWNGQTVLQAYYLGMLLMPTAPAIVSGILKNFLNSQHDDGSINFRLGTPGLGSSPGPGAGPTRAQLNATPILARMAWRLYEASPDRELLVAVLPGLHRFFESWFLPEQDRDGDGLPEWSSPLQSGLEDHPIYAHWLDGAPGLDITTVESPDLATFLYSEAQALINIAQILDRKEISKAVQKRLKILKSAVEKTYSARAGIYQTRDRETHQVSKAENLGERIGPGEIPVNRTFAPGARVCLTIQTSDGTLRRPVVQINGANPSGESFAETLTIDNFRWRPGTGHTTSQHIFATLEKVSIDDIGSLDQVHLATADHTVEDISGLLPLWARIPDDKKAAQILKLAILNPLRFSRPYGLPTSSLPPGSASDPAYHSIHLPWNMFVIEGLLAYGLHEAALDLFSRLMAGICENYTREGCFRRFYNAENGSGMGEADSLEGLAPTSLFLQLLGVQFLNEQQIVLSGRNPFPWAVTVKFKGITVLRQSDKTSIIFPNGQTALVTDTRPHLVQMS